MARMIRESSTWNRKHYSCPIFSKHCRILAKVFRKKSLLIDNLREAAAGLFDAIETRSTLFTDAESANLNVHVYVRIAGYAEQWINAPKDWNPKPNLNSKEQFHSLLKHLFCKYDMPNFFNSVWLETGSLTTEDRDLFCNLAQGGSLRQLVAHKDFTKKSAHWMMQAPDELSVPQAVQWGKVRALGGDDSRALAIAKACGSDTVSNITTDSCWTRFLQLCVHSKRELGSIEIEMLIDYLSYAKADSFRREKVFSLDKMTLQLIEKQSQTMWNELTEMGVKTGLFESVDLNNRKTRKNLISMARITWRSCQDVVALQSDDWALYELCSLGELAVEGREMSNCVKTYADHCYHGSCSIWTLRRIKQDKTYPSATIAINRNSKKITEARGTANRDLRDEEQRVIQLWMKQNRLVS